MVKRLWISSRACNTSSFSITSKLSIFIFNCSSVVAPSKVLATKGCWRTNANAICEGSRPCFFASATYSAIAAWLCAEE
ncbi:hypothetical protein D3C71_2111000 [compost metagenome]